METIETVTPEIWNKSSR